VNDEVNGSLWLDIVSGWTFDHASSLLISLAVSFQLVWSQLYDMLHNFLNYESVWRTSQKLF
jgi:hypothetical protein